MSKLIERYNQYILNLTPSKTWQVTRFILHWLTLPLKLLAIGGLGTYQILAKLSTKNRAVPEVPGMNRKRVFFKHAFNNMPVYKTENEELYVNRVPFWTAPDGTNHNTDHQCSRQGTYTFIMEKLGLRNFNTDNSMRLHVTYNGWLARGYKNHHLDTDRMWNRENVSGDMLCGMNMAVLNNTMPQLKQYYVNMVEYIIYHDYGLLETGAKTKSDRAMWQPGIETVGAQALTLLASLRLAEKNGSTKAGKEYRKMLYMYGYGLLSLFPTAYIDTQRGYFNDHNCLMSLYVLSKSSSNVLGKIFWALPMVYVFLLSRHWYNGYFTGLVRDCYPGLISKEYVEKCQAYLYEELPRTWTAEGVDVETDAPVPLKFNDSYEDEFYPDVKKTLTWKQFDPNLKCWGGLGFVAAAVMLEDDPKELLK